MHISQTPCRGNGLPNLSKRRRNTEKGKRSLIACLWILRNRITGCQEKTWHCMRESGVAEKYVKVVEVMY